MSCGDQSASAAKESAGGEIFLLALVLGAFLAVNLATGVRSPVVWTDEVFFADPAVNLATGHGFASDVSTQPGHQFFAANVPLYSLLLAGWIKVLGFTPLAVRSLPYVLIAAAAVMVWIALWRNLVMSPRGRLGVIIVMLLCNEITFSYRSARYDALGMLLCAIAFAAFAARGRATRMLTALLVGVLLPFAGLQLVIYAAVLSLLLWAFLGGSALRYSLVLYTGVCGGIGILCMIYAEHGVLRYFLDVVLHLSATGQSGRMAGSARVKLVQSVKNIFERPTILLSLILLAGMVWTQWRERRFHWRSIPVFGMAAGLVVPVGMNLAYDFPIYYGWMADIPLIICVVATLAQFQSAARWQPMRAAAAIVLVLIAFAGLPLRLAVTAMQWQGRDYAPVDMFVGGKITAADRAAIDHAAYYAVKSRGAICYGFYHLPVMTEEEKADVTVLVIDPADLSDFASQIGGQWAMVAEMAKSTAKPMLLFGRHITDQTSYHLAIYRRVSDL